MPSPLRRPIVLFSSGLFALILLVIFCIPPTRRPLSPSPNSSLSSSAKYYGPSPTAPTPLTRRRIHHLLPATSFNPDACKLLLTSHILTYPPPTLIGWGGHGRWNGSSNHLFKFPLFDEYFSTLGPESDDDLVFLFDAYDVWLQLPVEVMIQRYLLAISKENRRLERKGILDAEAVGGKVRNTVLFGADRLCWPQDPGKQIPCWSSPASLLPEYIMGPSTDHGDLEHAPAVRPRHLNSGTLIGRLADVRDFWNSTYEIVDKLLPVSEWKLKNSDQHYLHVLWNLQEEARLGLANGTMVVVKGGGEVGDGLVKRREFGVTVDGEGDVFQESLYHEYVTWMRFNHSSSSSSSSGKAREDNRRQAEMGRLDRLVLDEDIASSPGPFAADAVTSLLDGRGWEQMPLGMNVLTGTVFPLFHITPLKYLRDLWWGRMWFHPHAEALLLAGRRKWLGDGWREGKDGTGERVVATVEGVEYVAVEGSLNMTRTHKATDRDHVGLANGTAAAIEHLPRYFGKSGYVDNAPTSTKKQGGGKANWGQPIISELEDLPINIFHPKRRTNSNNFTTLPQSTRRRSSVSITAALAGTSSSSSSSAPHSALKTKFEDVDPEAIEYDEYLHGPPTTEEEEEELGLGLEKMSTASSAGTVDEEDGVAGGVEKK
ncbi:hypothetical protein TI39_contig405g00005 [Zymoseptoria brevis]|uniref:Uncharacterized protein n=1 Tax=Zymoseptoria brevis TaxID=1047168 RepID=A0A0F4GMU9_9PEZI|nr:hypothetical protein TI39_contig405g00005 [Zymoseptoria brevis]